MASVDVVVDVAVDVSAGVGSVDVIGSCVRIVGVGVRRTVGVSRRVRCETLAIHGVWVGSDERLPDALAEKFTIRRTDSRLVL